MTESAPRLSLSVVVPIFNEEKILEEMLASLEKEFDRIIGAGINDSTVPWVHIINIEQWDMVFFEWAWKNCDRYDLFLGSKRADPTLNHQSEFRRVLSWGLNAILQLLHDYIGADTHGPKLLNMETVRPLVSQCVMSRGQFDTELTLRTLREGLWIAEAPIEYIEHRAARNLMIKKIFLNLLDQIRLFRTLRGVPQQGYVKSHRYSRWDMNTGGSDLPLFSGKKDNRQ